MDGAVCVDGWVEDVWLRSPVLMQRVRLAEVAVDVETLQNWPSRWFYCAKSRAQCQCWTEALMCESWLLLAVMKMNFRYLVVFCKVVGQRASSGCEVKREGRVTVSESVLIELKRHRDKRYHTAKSRLGGGGAAGACLQCATPPLRRGQVAGASLRNFGPKYLHYLSLQVSRPVLATGIADLRVDSLKSTGTEGLEFVAQGRHCMLFFFARPQQLRRLGNCGSTYNNLADGGSSSRLTTSSNKAATHPHGS